MTASSSKYHSGVVARIISSSDGGPLRRIINGRSRRPTGTFISVKGGFRAMPWESMKCELPTLQLAEVGTPIISLVSQPHRLEMIVRGQTRPLIYFPDLMLTVEQDFADALRTTPFGLAVINWHARLPSKRGIRRVFVEVKDDNDSRVFDELYDQKLQLARAVYRRVDAEFITIFRSRDLECINLRPIKDISLDNLTAVCVADIDRAVERIEAQRGETSFGELVDSLGGGRLGEAKAHALHIRRMISIDLSRPVQYASAVRRVR
ncbi:hypothetical protein [Mesorhizobium sp. 1B3]|uniref:hypothetical protein n=1 Tax=Mesorhizobium sp. 1B3 TaxID=3243599 RepID=UPI003D98B646